MSTNQKEELDLKKIAIFAIGLIIIIIAIVFAVKALTKTKEQKVEREIHYYASFKDNKWGIIDSTGATVIDPSYQELIVVPNSKKDVFLCTFNVNYETGEYQTKALNKDNQEILGEYDKVEPITNSDTNHNGWYEENVIKVMKDGKYGIIDLDGNQIIPAEYTDIQILGENSQEGYIVKKDDNKYGIIDNSNNQVLEAKYDEIDKVHGSDLYVVTEGGTKKIINKDGQDAIASADFDKIIYISPERNENSGIIFEKAEKYGFMDLEGNIKIEPEYQNLTVAKDNILIAKKDDKYGIIDTDKNEKIPFENNSISYEKGADIYILEDSEYNAKVLNNNYEEKISGMFLDINTDNQYIKMLINDETKYYNFQFEEIPSTEAIKSATLYAKKQDGKYGFVNKKGDVVVDYQYEDATEQNVDGYAAVKKDGKWGAIDENGNVVVEPCYDLDEYLQIDFVGRWHKGIDLNMNYYSQE